MATRWAVATGLWSNTATWDGGTLPTSADDVYADGKTVTIDQNVTVLTLRTTTRSGGTAGGGFTLNAGFTLTATNVSSGIIAGTTACVTIGAGSTNTTINSNIGTPSTLPAVDMVTGSAPLAFNGNIVVNVVTNGVGIRLNGTGNSLTMVGSITGANGATTGQTIQGILVNGNGAVSLTGSLTAGTSATASNNYCINLGASAGNLTIVGNVTGGLGVGGSYAVNSTATAGSIYVTGNVTGGGGGSAHGIATVGQGASRVVSVVGTLTAGSGAGSHALIDTNTSGGFVQIAGTTIDNSFGDCAVSARRMRVVQTAATYRRFTNFTGYPSGTPITYGSLDYIPNNIPLPANVRSGTVYGDNQYTGTLAVPPTNSVASGVPVDNTTGTAALSPADIAALVGAQVAAAVSSPP